MSIIKNLTKLTLTNNVREVINLALSKGNYLHSVTNNCEKLDLNNHIASVAFGNEKLNFDDEEKIDIERYLNVRPALGVFPDDRFVFYLQKFMNNMPSKNKKVFLCSSGSEANEIALKMAMIYHGRKKVNKV